MVKASELRIGNRLQDQIGLETDLVVFKIEKDVITCGDEDFTYPYLTEMLKPIPLTSDLLDRFGFDNDGIFWDKDGVMITALQPKKTVYYKGRVVKKEIYSIHELQNTYADLIGTDLQIGL